MVIQRPRLLLFASLLLFAHCDRQEAKPRTLRPSKTESVPEMAAPPSVAQGAEGINIVPPNRDDPRKVIRGVFSVYVKGGSQLAIWSGFPEDIRVVATDLASGKVYESFDLSKSWQPDEAEVEEYASMPANQVVQESFEIELFDKLPALKNHTGTFELYVDYFSQTSNTVKLTLP